MAGRAMSWIRLQSTSRAEPRHVRADRPASRRSQAGFTLVELLVVSVIGMLLLGAIFQMLIVQERSFRVQGAVASTQQGMRTALDVLNTELREVAAVTGGTEGADIRAMSATSITFRAFRKAGVICLPGATSNVIEVQAIGDEFASGDSILVFKADETWTKFAITGVVAGNACGANWTAIGTSQTVTASGDVLTSGAIVGSPVRSFRWMTYQLYESAGQWMLGRQDHSIDAIQHLVGPLAAPADAGLAFRYFDVNGTETATPANVVRIEVTVKGLSPALGAGTGGEYTDEMSTEIFLRNN